MTSLLPTTVNALEHRLADEQIRGRAPSLVGAVMRAGELAWSGARGAVGVPSDVPTTDVQYRIGSITKTFTAALVHQLVDEGRLELADRVERYLPDTPIGERTVAALLAHTAGVAAETTPPWWERSDGRERSLDEMLGDAPLLHREGEVFHYSNVAYGVLGQLVATMTGTSWADALHERLLEPLHMTRTTLRPQPPHASGLAVHPWADVVLAEPEHDAGVLAPAGQLWSTVADLATWTQALAGRYPDVLPTASVEAMQGLAAVAEVQGDGLGWSIGHGLGVQIMRDGAGSRAGREARRLVGHTGSMPGFVATLWLAAPEDIAAFAFANTTAGLAISRLVADLVDLVAVAEPVTPPVWVPAAEVDPTLLALTGPWYWGPAAYTLHLRPDREFDLVPLAAGRRSRFVPGPVADTWTGLDGYFRGETLRVARDAVGVATHLDLASFVLTRGPYDPAGPVPGGVDDQGWRGRPG